MTIAAEGLRRIAELYAVEAKIRRMHPAERLSARQARTAPLVAAFGGVSGNYRAVDVSLFLCGRKKHAALRIISGVWSCKTSV